MGSFQTNIKFPYPNIMEVHAFVNFGKAGTENIVEWNVENLEYEINTYHKNKN